MKFYAINGSPRKANNTAQLLEKSLEGIKNTIDEEVETEVINLYDYNYQGCKECFACKLKDSPTYGHCIIDDDIKEIIEKVSEADGIIFGSPVFFIDVTGMLHSFIERLCFPYFEYTKSFSTVAPKNMPIGFITNMNVTPKIMEELDYYSSFKHVEMFLEVFSKPYTLYVANTYQFNDYAKYKVEMFSEEEKRKYRDEHFSEDLQDAYDMGVKIAIDAKKL